MEKFTDLLGSAIAYIIITAVVSFPIYFLWNDSLVPAVNWANQIDYSTAFGLMVLVNLLKSINITPSK